MISARDHSRVGTSLLPGPDTVDDRCPARSRAGVRIATAFLVAVAIGVRPRLLVGVPLLFVLFVPMEKLWPLHRQRTGRPGWGTDLVHLCVNGVLTALGTLLVVLVCVPTPLTILRVADRAWFASLGQWQLAVAFAVGVVGQYWGHRMMHAVPAFWRLHAAHHSSPELDWLAAARLHPLDQVLTQAPAAAALYALGYQAAAIAGVTFVLGFLAIFQHANPRWTFPGLRWVLPTPEWHHWHHAHERNLRDRNFSLPLVDLAFGTAYLPRDVRPRAYGIDEAFPRTGYLAQLTWPFRSQSSEPAPETTPVLRRS